MAHPDFEELLAEFNAARVRYLIGGAHALALHVHIDSTRANFQRALSALRNFFGGNVPRYVDAAALTDPDSIVQLGVAPVRLDLLSHFATTTFRNAWKRRTQAKFGTVPAGFVGTEDFIAEKTHFARPQDLADLVVLRRARARRARSVGQRKKVGRSRARK